MRKKITALATVAIMVVASFLSVKKVDAAGKTVSSDIMHEHDGDSVNGGECYEPEKCGGNVATYSYEGTCGGYLRSKPVLSTDGTYATFDCTICGVYTWSRNGGENISNWYNDYWQYYTRCQNGKTYTGYRCQTCLTTYSGVGTCTKVKGYKMTCVLPTDAPVGTIKIEVDNKDWTNTPVTLTPSKKIDYELEYGVEDWIWKFTIDETDYTLTNIAGSLTLSFTDANLVDHIYNPSFGSSVISNVNGDKIVVTEQGVLKTQFNGTYTFEVPITTVGTSGYEVSYKVTNYDGKNPEAIITKSTESFTNQDVLLTVNASDDLSGLADAPYSYDNGVTWTADNTYTCVQNGTYSVWVRDKAGNINKKEVVVNNIDKVKPTFTYLEYSETEYTNQDVILVITADDDLSGLSLTPYSYDNGVTWTADNSITYTVNGTYKVMIADAAGNTEEVDIVIQNIDKTLPVVENVVLNPTEFTNLSVKATVTASDDLSGVAVLGYSYDNGITWRHENTYHYVTNGQHTVQVKDNAGNIAFYQIEIDNIDRVKPTITSFTPSETEYTKNDVVLTVVASDDYSGLADAPYSYDGKTTWVSDTTFTTTENGVYTVYVKDKAGNEETVSYEVLNIDKEAPDVIITQEQGSFMEAIVTVIATDALSGLPTKPYSYDNGVTWVSKNTNTYDANGTYPISVRDVLGNIVTVEYPVVSVDNIPPVLDVTYDDKPTNQDVIITVNAVDNETGLNPVPYSYDGGLSWTVDETLIIEENGTYTVKVRDVAGNIQTKIVVIDNIDKKAPYASRIDYSTLANTGDNVTVTVIGVDAGLGLDVNAYSFNNGTTWSAKGTTVIEENGTYAYKIRDKVGNIFDGNFTVENIRKNTLVVSNISVDKKHWTNQAVILSVNVADHVKGDLSPTPYSWNSSEYSSSNSFTVTKNGVYSVKVKDIYGNIVEKIYHVKNIDTEYPTLNVVAQNAYQNNIFNIVAEASDSVSGIAEYGYSFDAGSTWVKENYITITEPGIYVVYVKDNAGNISQDSIVMKEEDFVIYNDGSDKSEVEKPRVEEVEVKEEVRIEIQEVELGKPSSENVSYVVKSTETGLPEKAPQEEVVVVKKPKVEMTPVEVATTVSTVAGTTVMISFAGIAFFSTVPLYAIEDDKKKFIKRVRVRRKGLKYSVKITKSVFMKNKAADYVLVFKDLKYRAKQGKELLLELPDETIIKLLDKEVYFSEKE